MIYSLGDLTIDTGRQLVSRGVEAIPLPKLSYDLLLALVRAAPNLVSLDELMRSVWLGIIVSPETVSQRVKLLRDALHDDPRAPRYIGGLRGRGYQIIVPIAEQTAEIIAPSMPVPPPSADSLGLAAERDVSPRANYGRRIGLWTAAIAAMAILAIVVAIARRPPHDRQQASRAPVMKGRTMLAVLPFQNLSKDPEQEYLGDGLTAETVADLGELSPERLVSSLERRPWSTSTPTRLWRKSDPSWGPTTYWRAAFRERGKRFTSARS